MSSDKTNDPTPPAIPAVIAFIQSLLARLRIAERYHDDLLSLILGFYLSIRSWDDIQNWHALFRWRVKMEFAGLLRRQNRDRQLCNCLDDSRWPEFDPDDPSEQAKEQKYRERMHELWVEMWDRFTESDESDPGKDLEEQQLIERVREIQKTLPEKERKAVEAHLQAGSIRKAADLLHWTPGEVKYYHQRAIEAFQRKLMP